MILGCPFCNTRYLIPANVFAAGPRRVRCARCFHDWQAELPKEVDAIPASPSPVISPLSSEPPPMAPRPIPPGSNLPVLPRSPMPASLRRILLAGAAAAALILLGWFVFDRREIAGRWPKLETFYEKAGLHIYHYGEGLSLENVRSELRYDGGIMMLTVDGTIYNRTKNVQEIPNIVASAIGPDGNVLQNWQIDAPKASIAPDEGVPFNSSIPAPKDKVTEAIFNFVEKKNAAE
jgi:predicted Zn finger-like uncharacterized protein